MFCSKCADHVVFLDRYTRAMVVVCCIHCPVIYIRYFSWCYPTPILPPPVTPPLYPHPLGPGVWCFPPCVHVFSLFNTHLWVRTCNVWFSVLVSFCWEWWFPALSMSLPRTWTHSFLWLHSIPWCMCATFSLSSLSLMGIWVGSKSLLLQTVPQWTYMCMCPYNRMIYNPLVIYPAMGLPDQMVFVFLDPWEIATLSFTMAELIYTPTNSV